MSKQATKEAGSAEAGGSRRWLILLAMTGSLAMIMLDTTVVAVALPSIQKGLNVDQNLLEWVIVAYLVILASFMALGGKLGDLFGKPRAFVIGTIGFGLSSLMCGLSWNGEALVLFRVCQGFFAVVMQPASSAIVINSFEPGERGKAMAVYAGIPLLFMTAGPVVGGFITEYASWRYCFLLNVPISLLVGTLAVVLRPRDPGLAMRKRFDWAGTALLGVGMPCFVRQTGDSLRVGAILRVDRVRRAGPSTCAGTITGAPTFFRWTGAVAGAFFRRFVASRSALAGVASSSGL